MTVATFNITGRVGNVREGSEGDKYYYVNIGVNKSYKPKDADRVERTDWFFVRVRGSKVAKTFSKGNLVQITGDIWTNTKKLEGDQYETQTGFDVREFSLLAKAAPKGDGSGSGDQAT